MTRGKNGIGTYVMEIINISDAIANTCPVSSKQAVSESQVYEESPPLTLRQQPLHHMTMHIGEPITPTLELVGQSFVINPQQMQ